MLRFSLYSFTAVFLSVCFKVLGYFMYVYVYVYVCYLSECALVRRCLQGLEMGVRCPGRELEEVVRNLTWVLGTELQFSARAAIAQNH